MNLLQLRKHYGRKRTIRSTTQVEAFRTKNATHLMLGMGKKKRTAPCGLQYDPSQNPAVIIEQSEITCGGCRLGLGLPREVGKHVFDFKFTHRLCGKPVEGGLPDHFTCEKCGRIPVDAVVIPKCPKCAATKSMFPDTTKRWNCNACLWSEPR